MVENLVVHVGRTEVEEEMFEGICEGRLPWRHGRRGDGEGWKAGGNAGRCKVG